MAHSDDHSAWLLKQERILHSPYLISPDQPLFWRFAGNARFRFDEDHMKQVHDLGWDYPSGSHGEMGLRADLDFQLVFIADLEAAIRQATGAHPFSEFVDPSAEAHTGFLSNFLATIAREATDILRSKCRQFYGFEHATTPNAANIARTMLEYR